MRTAIRRWAEPTLLLLLLLVPLEALFTWGQGIANALTVGVILLVVVGGGQWVIYRVIVKRVSKW